MNQLLTSEQINNAFHAMYSHHNFYYGTFPSIYRANKEITLKALTKDGLNLAFSSSNLRNDKEVVLAAVKNNGLALEYAADHFKNDKEVVLPLIKRDIKILTFASDNPH